MINLVHVLEAYQTSEFRLWKFRTSLGKILVVWKISRGSFRRYFQSHIHGSVTEFLYIIIVP
jgi:hypothetical protein